ncbi:ferritin family protein [Pelotalea chapellei]|uniref:Ferritin family protein n=1 Tax=Pelotalea chapellei TaxID=44671 RepID=A0ABS5U9E4_9BACT|nr:ferritin family protein [Pelotalea chapellei]MBT1072256.1 ferritin family protein [Pelotalea chapellei]
MSNNKEMLDAIMRAIELEKETFDFYVKAEHKTFNPAGKRIFKWLASTEEAHYMKLSDLYNSLHESGRWVFYGGSDFGLVPTGDEHQVTFETDDIEALQIARDIEQRGINLYEEMIGKASDPQGKSMLETLRNEEIEHLRIITEKLETLK